MGNQWVSVKERLPEGPSMPYLLVLMVGPKPGFPSVEMGFWRGGEGWIRQPWMRDWPVTHWMPLPEPPKEDK